MSEYQYKARSANGSIIAGLVEAPNESAAARLLHDKQLFVIRLKQNTDALSFANISKQFQKISFGDIVNFTRQLSTMITAGLPLPEALSILRSQATNKTFVTMLEDVEHQIVGGGSLAEALSKYKEYFSTTYLSLIRAGESSGTLDQVLGRLADILETQKEFRGKIQGAMIYPMIIMIAMMGVVFVMMTVVVPKLTDLYREFNIVLPLSTRILMGVSGFFVKFWWLMILVIIGSVRIFQAWRKTPEGELIVDSLTLKIPLFGELQKKVMLVEFTRTLGMLIASGIHILDGLQILQNSLSNVLFRNALRDISKKVEKGFPLGDTFAQFPMFPPIVSQMMKVGEETGKLDDTLSKLSKYFQMESESLVKGLTTAIEPLIMVFLGAGVGFIVISIITPIYNLTSQFK